MRRLAWLALLAGCVAWHEPGDPPRTWTVAELRDEQPAAGNRLALDEVIVISPRTADGAAFYVQDPGGGPDSGLRVRLAGAIAPWPPPVGTPVALGGTLDWAGDDPVLWLADQDDGAILGEPVEPAATPWALGLEFALVSLEFVEITSQPDPTGRADTSAGATLVDAFDVALPGWGAVGDLTAVAVGEGRVAPRTARDWAGPLDGEPPLQVDLADLAGLAEGTLVVLDDVVVATPFSADGRWTVLQDATGAGLWVDTEGFALERPAAGDAVLWQGEVRSDGEGLHLRTWHAPEVAGTGDVQLVDEAIDGALVRRMLTDPGPPDAWGRRATAEGIAVDDRFLPLEDLPDPFEARGPVRIGDDDTVILHPIAVGAP